jgi:Nucleoside-diphosphate-sugar epimerases
LKILVTGGSGLIGSAIVRRLLDLEHESLVFLILKRVNTKTVIFLKETFQIQRE